MSNLIKTALIYTGGVAVGAISGVFGGGGGMLAVPLLQCMGLSEKRAHATALSVILPLCVICSIVYIHSGYFERSAMICACIGVVFGGIIGAISLDKLNSTAIGIIFGTLMIAVGIKSVIV